MRATGLAVSGAVLRGVVALTGGLVGPFLKAPYNTCVLRTASRHQLNSIITASHHRTASRHHVIKQHHIIKSIASSRHHSITNQYVSRSTMHHLHAVDITTSSLFDTFSRQPYNTRTLIMSSWTGVETYEVADTCLQVSLYATRCASFASVLQEADLLNQFASQFGHRQSPARSIRHLTTVT